MVLDFSRLPDLSAEQPELDPDELLLAGHTKARRDALWMVFGDTAPTDHVIRPMERELLAAWPHGGILRHPPSEDRTDWTYVTHGLAHPRHPDAAARFARDDERPSGRGIELAVSTEVDVTWAPKMLMSLARHLVLRPEAPNILPLDRMPLHRSVDGRARTELRYLLARNARGYEHELILPGGLCDLVHLVGITLAEFERTRTLPAGAGSAALVLVLDVAGVGSLTDPRRQCVTTRPDFEELWAAARDEVEAGIGN